MAGYGMSDIRTRYCKLNTWWQWDGSFQHNTPGFMKHRLSSKDEMEDPNTERADSQMEGAHYDEREARDKDWTSAGVEEGVAGAAHERVQNDGDDGDDDSNDSDNDSDYGNSDGDGSHIEGGASNEGGKREGERTRRRTIAPPS
ncbi:hypothetical protein RRF57_012237 [Xylaria bambusicola]|uniref:Uncharacterized protein n=1 Tax=Xylaria bambusicola TaxID=326684 RepID=A0AAN7UP80_9PEZI